MCQAHGLIVRVMSLFDDPKFCEHIGVNVKQLAEKRNIKRNKWVYESSLLALSSTDHSTLPALLGKGMVQAGGSPARRSPGTRAWAVRFVIFESKER